jgi:hypothetical protein
LIIVPRSTIARELDFWGSEVTKGIFRGHDHRFITRELVEEWVNKVRMAHNAEQREIMKVTDWGLLRLDRYTCHSLAWLESKRRENAMSPIVPPRHFSE